METRVLAQMRASLQEKRHNLADWWRTAPAAQRRTRLGTADEAALQQHLETLAAADHAAAEETLGICTVCHEYVDEDLLQMDYTTSVCLSHLSEEQQRTLESELQLAAAVQKSLLPQQVPESPYLQIAAYSRPAQIIGGDYFGFFEFKDGAQGLAIADVAGHGVSASLHMAGVHALLQTLVPTNDCPADVLEHVHRLFVHNASFSTFVTVFLAAYDPQTRVLTYCNAGHNAPLLVSCQDDDHQGAGRRAIAWLRPTAPAVGLVDGIIFQVARVRVHPGDALLLYTDGVTEAIDSQGQDYGTTRLAELLTRSAEAPAREILNEVRQELERFVDGQPLKDDTTLVVCKFIQ
jgi:phosphoserine phosphatase RsbU/P